MEWGYKPVKNYEIDVCGVKRTLPFIAINDTLAFASFVVISDTELVRAAAAELVKKIPADVEILVTAEAKGIVLCYELSRLLNMKCFVVARKSVKSYMRNFVGGEVNSITTKGTQKLILDGVDADRVRGKRVCLVDDVISTGESIKALEELVKEAGGNVVSRVAILAEGDAAKRTDIAFLERLPLFEKDENGEYQEI
ncbi:MAG: adenine phosphoribosyltransferase [Verrucomicrobia bacterium]|nr:adenine phosphoribosyltransferase [Lachnospiraceae bacterium]MBR4248576.1 adenine phosphoribosyltransferase [Verrucomicrobiota bacterium]